MGALHDGHFALIDRARHECDRVAVTLFVNPLQFGPDEDLSRYPRTLDADLDACRKRGVDLVFCPPTSEMYPSPSAITVSAGVLADRLCGRGRPGHFDGVCTVVTKLFHIICAHCAYFGEKDYQQLVIIRRMARDLNFPIEIVGCETVREQDGLAMSSRNRYLTPPVRKQTAGIYASLQKASDQIRQGQTDASVIIRQIEQDLRDGGADNVEYAAVVDPQSLDAVDRINQAVRICVAAWYGDARLIDNIAVDAPGNDK